MMDLTWQRSSVRNKGISIDYEISYKNTNTNPQWNPTCLNYKNLSKIDYHPSEAVAPSDSAAYMLIAGSSEFIGKSSD